MKRNPHMHRLKENYLFPEINQRKSQFLKKHPEASLVSLGVGDTTEPLPHSIAMQLQHAAAAQGQREGYTGYGPEQGIRPLRAKIASELYPGLISADEVFISDGAKCDLGRLQMLFGQNVSIAVQDPTYPVYVEGSIIQGVEKIAYMPCGPRNDFFPNLDATPRTDLIYFCSPNNPTGQVATRKQLEQLVAHAAKNHSIIIFDAAYASYIRDPTLPKSIYEIEGAREVAIEIGSFSKLAGFTGLRLSWCIIPEELTFDDGHSVKADWNRLTSTIYNGASNIAQHGGLAVLTETGLQEISAISAHYLQNAKIIKDTLEALGYTVYGGVNAPYLWVPFPGASSWDMFQHFLEEYHIVTTPGSGFGWGGEGFIRFSSFGARSSILQATNRLKEHKAMACIG